jgi:hypothetical protein
VHERAAPRRLTGRLAPSERQARRASASRERQRATELESTEPWGLLGGTRVATQFRSNLRTLRHLCQLISISASGQHLPKLVHALHFL